jgi:modified peptide precursor CbpA
MDDPRARRPAEIEQVLGPDGKGFRGAFLCEVPLEPFLLAYFSTFSGRSRAVKTKEAVRKSEDVIASRKSCSAQGTGLSHYILMDKQAQKKK